MSELHLPWLELSVLIPLAGAISVGLMANRDRARRVTISVCAAVLFCSLCEWADFSTLNAFEAHDHWDLLQTVFHKDVFVIDELSAPLLPLAALLYLLTVMTTLRTKVNRFSFGWTLLSESLLLATLSCRNPWIIIALMALSTVPPWLELRQRRQSTRIFVLHMGLSAGLMGLGQLLVPSHASAANPPILAGCLLTAGALIRSGIAPVHAWMTDLFEKATLGTALLFVTPMTGAYAVMRLVFPIAPAWALQSIAVVSLLTAVYAAAMALVQHEARRYFCFLFLSHSSLVLVGLEMATPIGLSGGLCVWLSIGISLLGFGLTLRSVEARTGRLSLDAFHGLYEHTPVLAGLFLLTGLASIGFPGTIGFVGMELLVEGAVGVYPYVGLCVVIAAMLNGIGVLLAWFRIFTGTRRPATASLHCRMVERIAIVVLTALIVGAGIYPQAGVLSRFHAAVALMDHRAIDDHTSQPHPEARTEADSQRSAAAPRPAGQRLNRTRTGMLPIQTTASRQTTVLTGKPSR